jgi:cysteine peptidase C11 family protein
MCDTPTEKATFLLRPRSKGSESAEGGAEWGVMAYLAADNDLEGELLADLAEMELVGSRPGVVEILAQVDRSPGQDTSKGNWHGTRRYYVTRGENPRRINSRILVDLGPTNTGDPRVLESFMRFGAQRYPSKATALILMNHGSGFYVPPEMLSRGGETSARRAPVPAQRRRRRRPLFHTTQERLLNRPPTSRGIAYDDGAGDCLDNQELKRVLAKAHRLLGRKVDVVGMDACLMTMLEVAYQLKDHAKVLVGSEELEPGPGWPHAAILGDLARTPAMTAAELGATIVRWYVESYRHGAEEATQSAIDLGQLGDLVRVVDLLARLLLAGLNSTALASAVHAARRRTLEFFDGLYVDLHHLAGNLATTAGPGPVADACVEIQRVIEGQGTRGPIIAAGHVGSRMTPARGLSIYFPAYRDPSIHYRELDFARRIGWGEFLNAYMRTDRAVEPSPVP